MTTQLHQVLQHLRRAGLRHDVRDLDDGQLLERFLRGHDAAALEALVGRHGPMVWGVCRRLLANLHDAEDAFQATFLVLARRAASIRPRARVGPWLYGVAQQTARKARASAARQRARQRSLDSLPEPAAAAPECDADWHAVLDQELSRLPDKYRAALVLCDLQEKTRKEAARQLGVPEGTLAARVARGRALLARQLARRGLAVSAGTLAGLLAPAAAPAALTSATVQAVTLLAEGQVASLLSSRVVLLTRGVLNAMLLTRIKSVLTCCLGAALLLLGSVSGYLALAGAQGPPAPDRLADTLILLDKQWWEATSRHDVDTLGKILAADWSCQAAHWTRAFSLDHYRHWRYTEVKFLSERRVVRIDERTALMTYELSWAAASKDQGAPPSRGHDRLLHCWVQHDGGWFVKYTECVNLPLAAAAKPSVRASGFWTASSTPEGRDPRPMPFQPRCLNDHLFRGQVFLHLPQGIDDFHHFRATNGKANQRPIQRADHEEVTVAVLIIPDEPQRSSLIFAEDQ